ncbi:leucine-rich repeat protein [Acetobacterium woodii]|uniref:Cell surface protein n=1 Tax=Acetobacterium woodii (strain ATCC 29683 / DSM 1030 / JCM 2381 / KCTC 1655 / WB1) TaxID=931626 RepID=H6LBL6_ACEWD|nr:leucine-rich repeat protein [Acetobacterium woodii]AFA50139.1 cell surface protein [Acetobacterium woodii DSM 1030]
MKKKEFERIFVFLLVLVTTLLVGNISVNAATSGDYEYSVNPDGITCQITGYTGAGGNIVIPATIVEYTVTSFAEYAFADKDVLTSVTIPNGVISIAKGTFANCNKMTSITIPSSVTSVGSYAFDRCSSLINITIPSSVTSIGNYAFNRCSSLINITMPNSVSSIGAHAFSVCSSLTNIKIPDSVTSIADATFADCTSLSSVTISSSVTFIDKDAFYSCTSLTNITIPSSVEEIKPFAFDKCSNLANVFFDGELQVNQFAFINTNANLYCPNGNSGYFTTVSVQELETKTITINLTGKGTVTPSVTSGMPGETINLNIIPEKGYCLKSGSLKYYDNSYHGINETIFTMPSSDITVFAEFELDTIEPKVDQIFPSGTGIPISLSNISIVFSKPVTGLSNKKVSVSDGSNIYVYTIGESDNYFGGTASGDTATIPISRFLNGTEHLSLNYNADYIVAIEAGAYIDDASNLILGNNNVGSFSTIKAYTYTVNPDGTSCIITSYSGIGGNITIPASLDGYTVTSFAEYAFADCGVLTGVTIPSGVTSISKGAFANCSNLNSVTIPNSVISIGPYAFDQCSSLTGITIPDSVKSIGDYAFKDCSSLNSINILNGVTSIGDSAFSYCSKLTEVIIPSSVTAIANNAFFYCSGLNKVAIAGGVTSIGDNALTGCTGLTEISVDEANTYYSSLNGVLYNFDKTALICYPTGLSGAFTIPSSITSIGNNAFSNCSGLTGVTIPVSVTTIEVSAFSGCINLASVTIPSSITFLGNSAFQYCAALNHAYFDGHMPTTGLSVFDSCSGSLEYHSPSGNPGGITLSPLTTLETKAVTVSPTENGTISSSTIEGMPGETISLEITPVTGYRLKPGSLEYNDGSHDYSISGTSFTMPDNAITISGVFVEIDNTVPTANLVAPSGTSVALSAADMVLGFSETVTAVENKSVTISDGTNDYIYTIGVSDGYVSGIGSDCKATIPIQKFLNGTAPLSLGYNTTYTVTLEAGAYIDSADNETAASSIGSFKTEAEPIIVTSVTVKTAPTKITYTAGELLDLTGLVVTLNKSNSTTEDVPWADFGTKGITTTPTNGTGLSDSDSAVNITYTADNQSVSQSITVNPVTVTVTSVTVKTTPTKITYTAGELLDLTGLVVTLNKSNSTTEDVPLADFATKGITTTPTNGTGLSDSDNAVNITYTADNQSVSQSITVNPVTVTVTSVTVKTAPTKITYTAGDLLDLSGLVVTLNKSNSTTEDVPLADFATKGITTTPTNGTGLSDSDNAVTITYTADHQSVSQSITVNPAAVTVTSVTVKTAPTKITYTAGDLLDLTSLVITLHKSDSTTEDVPWADFATKGITTTPTNGTGLSDSDNAVTITYTADNQSVSQGITVNPVTVTVTSVTVKTAPTKITYTAGDLLDLSGLVVTLHKSDSTTEDVAYADFATKGITTTPTNGTGLSDSDSAVNITYTADHQSVSQSITVKVAPAITTNSLDNGVVGTAYGKSLTATADSPITWSIDSGDLPDGLTLNANTGHISGTPTTSGTFSFTVKAINNEGDDIKALSIYISSASSGNNGGNTGGDSPTPDPEAHLITTSSSIIFGSLTAGYTTPPAIQTMMVKNTGNQSVTLTQPTSEHYAIGPLSNNLLNKDETVTFTIQPKLGLAAGSYNESLSIVGTNGASVSIPLSFTVAEAPVAEKSVTVAYRGHIQNIGDYPLDGSWVNSPEIIGTVGQSKRIEGFEIRLEDTVPTGMELRYNVHVENKGWLYDENDCADWPKDGAYAGTRGESLRIEAVKLVLTDKDGKPYPGYSVYYRGHVQNIGDLPTESTDWYADGEKLGTVGSALRLEALLVKVVKNETDLSAY